MAKLFSDLQVGTRVYLDESNQADFLDSEVKRSINYAYQDVASEIMEVWEDYYFTTTPISITTVANQQEYSLDSSLVKIRRVEVNYKPTDVNSVPLRAKSIKIDELSRYLADPNAGGSALFACGYYVTGNQSAQIIGLVPIPTVGGIAAAKVWGIQAPSDMVNASDAVVLPYVDRFAQLVELKAAVDLLRKGQQAETDAERYMQEYIAGVNRMKTFLSEREPDGVVMIQDAAQEDVAFDFPY